MEKEKRVEETRTGDSCLPIAPSCSKQTAPHSSQFLRPLMIQIRQLDEEVGEEGSKPGRSRNTHLKKI